MTFIDWDLFRVFSGSSIAKEPFPRQFFYIEKLILVFYRSNIFFLVFYRSSLVRTSIDREPFSDILQLKNHFHHILVFYRSKIFFQFSIDRVSYGLRTFSRLLRLKKFPFILYNIPIKIRLYDFYRPGTSFRSSPDLPQLKNHLHV